MYSSLNRGKNLLQSSSNIHKLYSGLSAIYRKATRRGYQKGLTMWRCPNSLLKFAKHIYAMNAESMPNLCRIYAESMQFFLSSVHLLQDVEFRPAGHQVSPSFIAPLIALHTFIHIIHIHKMLPFRFMSTNTQTMHRIKLARPSFAATWRVGTKGWAACNGRNFFPFQTKKQW
jgi:hypothetical protein